MGRSITSCGETRGRREKPGSSTCPFCPCLAVPHLGLIVVTDPAAVLLLCCANRDDPCGGVAEGEGGGPAWNWSPAARDLYCMTTGNAGQEGSEGPR